MPGTWYKWVSPKFYAFLSIPMLMASIKIFDWGLGVTKCIVV